jgi:hypothetical protein
MTYVLYFMLPRLGRKEGFLGFHLFIYNTSPQPQRHLHIYIGIVNVCMYSFRNKISKKMFYLSKVSIWFLRVISFLIIVHIFMSKIGIDFRYVFVTEIKVGPTLRTGRGL